MACRCISNVLFVYYFNRLFFAANLGKLIFSFSFVLYVCDVYESRFFPYQDDIFKMCVKFRNSNNKYDYVYVCMVIHKFVGIRKLYEKYSNIIP